jgi:hypothetical protein
MMAEFPFIIHRIVFDLISFLIVLGETHQGSMKEITKLFRLLHSHQNTACRISLQRLMVVIRSLTIIRRSLPKG